MANSTTRSTSCCVPSVARRQHAATSSRRLSATVPPINVTVDKSDVNLATLHQINAQRERPIVIRQTKYLSNIVEEYDWGINCRPRPMIRFRNFRCVHII